MSDENRRFECHMPGGPEQVEIINVLVQEGNICLVIKSARRDSPYVMQVLPGGMRFAHSDLSQTVLDIHEGEMKAAKLQAREEAKASSA